MNNLFSLGSMLNNNKIATANFAKGFRQNDNSLYKQREKNGVYDKMAEKNPQLAQMQRSIDKMNAESGSVLDRILSPETDMNAVTAKLNSGQKLSSSEMEYLKSKDPELYNKAVQIEAERKAYEEKLKNCKTKEDVQRLQTLSLSTSMAKINSVVNNPNIPKGKKLEMIQDESRKVKAINDATAKFVKSAAYAKLPTDAELSEKHKKAHTHTVNPELLNVHNKISDADKQDKIDSSENSGEVSGAPEQPGESAEQELYPLAENESESVEFGGDAPEAENAGESAGSESIYASSNAEYARTAYSVQTAKPQKARV